MGEQSNFGRMCRMTVWFTKSDAAKYISVSERLIQNAVNAGELPAYPIGHSGRSYRLRAEDIDEWMTSRSWEPRQE